MEFLRRILYFARRRQNEADLAREMACHRAMMGDASPGFGNDLRLREDARDVWGWSWLDRLWQDLTYGARILAVSPGFTLTAALTLALGIGVTLTMVRIALVQIRPTEPDPDTLVHLTRRAPGMHSTEVSVPMLDFYRARARSFRAVIGRTDSTGDIDSATAQPLAFVTGNYFAEMGLHASFGRLLDPADEASAAEPVAVLSRSDAMSLGRTVRVNGKPLRIVGVLEPHKGRAVIWIPLTQQPYVVEGSTLLTAWNQGLTMHARLVAGVTPKASEAETKALSVALRGEHPRYVQEGEWLDAEPLSHIDPELYARGALAAALVLLVLVVACTNLGTLLLARGVSREREIAIRLALGAGRRRLVRQLFTESLMLSALGCAGALILSSSAVKILQLRLGDAGVSTVPDGLVLAATLAIGLLAALSFGLAPALRLTGSAPRAGRARTVFVSIQVGASCLLLMMSGLIVRSFERLAAVDPGFDFHRVAMVEPRLNDHGYQGPAALAALHALRDRLLALPGVDRVSVVWLPVWGNTVNEFVFNGHHISANHVDPEFLRATGLRLDRGRNFDPSDQDAAIVSASLARLLWPGEDPLGKKLPLVEGTVVGVVRQADTFRLRSETLALYFPLTAKDAASASLVVRVVDTPAPYLGRFAAAAKALDSRLLPSVRTLDQAYSEAFSSSLNLVAVMGSLGILSLLLAAIGLAGLTSYTVSHRTREIGVRIALGARGAQVVRGVLSPMFRPVLIGFAFGTLGAAAVAATLKREMFGLQPLDPLAYLMAIALFTVVILAATAAPARRAMRVNPADALRHN